MSLPALQFTREPVATKCQCGAFTVELPDGSQTFCKGENLSKFFPKLNTFNERVFAHCNHCVNHWGLDLCDCGCGADKGECTC